MCSHFVISENSTLWFVKLHNQYEVALPFLYRSYWWGGRKVQLHEGNALVNVHPLLIRINFCRRLLRFLTTHSSSKMLNKLPVDRWLGRPAPIVCSFFIGQKAIQHIPSLSPSESEICLFFSFLLATINGVLLIDNRTFPFWLHDGFLKWTSILYWFDFFQ